MSEFAAKFVFASIAVGVLALVAGVATGHVAVGFALVTLPPFVLAYAVLWDHARDA